MNNNTYDSERCVVCLEGTVLLYFFTPCLHQCICEACAVKYNDNYHDNEQFNVCPVCRNGYLSIEFDESKFPDTQQNRVSADTATQQLWTTFESKLQEMMPNLNALMQKSTNSARPELQEQLSTVIEQIEKLTLTVTCKSDGHVEKQSQQLLRDNIPGPSNTSSSETTSNSVRDLVKVFERNDVAVEENAVISQRDRGTMVPLPRSSGAIRRTTTNAGSTREAPEEDPAEMKNYSKPTGLPNTQSPVFIIMVQHEIINTYMTNDESTTPTVITGHIWFEYPTESPFQVLGNEELRNLSIQMLNQRHTLYCEIDKSYYCVPPSEDLTLSEIESIPKKKILTYHVLNPEFEVRPLEFTADWNVESKATYLTIKYRYNPKTISLQSTLISLQIIVTMNAGFTDYDAEPMAKRDGSKLIWKLPDLTPKDANDYRTLTAKIHFTRSIFNPKGYIKANRKGIVFAQFDGTENIPSGTDFITVGANVATFKCFSVGKYFCEGSTQYN